MMSMTGYGASSSSDDQYTLEIEICTVNSRFFKFTSRIPSEYAAYEIEIKNLIMQKISRGSINVTLNYSNSEITSTIINTELLKKYHSILTNTCQELDIPNVTIDKLLSFPDVVTQKSEKLIPDLLWHKTKDLISDAVQKIDDMRRKEGEGIAFELLGFCKKIEHHVGEISIIIPEVIEKFKKRVNTRIKEFIREESLFDNDQDILKEIAIFAEKIDINEELSRLKSHLIQFKETALKQEPIGKRLEFLTLEMLRESNTIASKANSAKCSQYIVNIKNYLEKMREQIQNIE